MDKKQLLAEHRSLQADQRAVDPSQFSKSFTNLRYGADSPDQALDVFLPESEGRWPVVVFIHGGGWYFGGRREECISSVFKIVSQGYAVATVDYRLVPDVTFPKQVQDVKAAIRYLRAHEEELQLDTEKLVLWGNSAGAYLAALAAAKGNFPQLEDLSMGNEAYSSQVDGLIAWYGVYDLLTNNAQMRQLYPDYTGDSSPIPAMLGQWTEEKAREASPVSYVTPAYPPILLQQGKKDKQVPYLQTQEFYEKICQICGPDRAILEYFPEAGHGDTQIKADANILRCLQFLDSIYYSDRPCPYPRKALPELRFVASACQQIDPYEPV